MTQPLKLPRLRTWIWLIKQLSSTLIETAKLMHRMREIISIKYKTSSQRTIWKSCRNSRQYTPPLKTGTPAAQTSPNLISRETLSKVRLNLHHNKIWISWCQLLPVGLLIKSTTTNQMRSKNKKGCLINIKECWTSSLQGIQFLLPVIINKIKLYLSRRDQLVETSNLWICSLQNSLKQSTL